MVIRKTLRVMYWLKHDPTPRTMHFNVVIRTHLSRLTIIFKGDTINKRGFKSKSNRIIADPSVTVDQIKDELEIALRKRYNKLDITDMTMWFE